MSDITVGINNALQIIRGIKIGAQSTGPNSDLPHYESNVEFLDKERQIQHAEDRLLQALEDRDDSLYDNLINPATGMPYTEAEKTEALQNAINREINAIESNRPIHPTDQARLDELRTMANDINLAEQRITHPERFDENGNPLIYGDVPEISSHNSYEREETIFEQYKKGVRSFELDIHHPVNEGEFPVYHDDPDDNTHYENLSDGLNDIIAIHEYDPDHDVITLHVDIKQFLGDAHSEDDFGSHDLDGVLRRQLGDMLYTPEDFMNSTNTESLTDAHKNGMPTLVELEGKVMVVMTGPTELLEAYVNESTDPAGFISVYPEFDNGVFVPNPNAIFYNTDDLEKAATVADQGYTTRFYVADNTEEYKEAVDAGAAHIASDDV